MTCFKDSTKYLYQNGNLKVHTCIMRDIPEWEEARLVQKGPQRPVDLPTLYVLHGCQVFVCAWDVDPIVKHRSYPGRLEALQSDIVM